ncbi:hypothetical protein RND81_02G040400 [Saponaria officinalis]|uniref:Uncharacterized protein n=1 Tax=Saponaria officinalis TaxID=3572 RepID=A0AAW1MV53_SAPOF
MESTTAELSLNCFISTGRNNLEKTKMRYYIIVTLFHGCSSKFDKYSADVDAKGIAKFQFKDVNVESDYLRFQVFSHRKLLSDKHVSDINVHVSELVSSQVLRGHPLSATYELEKASSKAKKRYLKLSYELSSRRKDSAAVALRNEKPKVESERPAAAIGNDIRSSFV